MMKRNDGFTLIELLCAIVAGSIVTAATATILLLGLRMNANATKMATQDNKVVIGLTVLGNIAKENGNIQVLSEGEKWEVRSGLDENTDGKNDTLLYSYAEGNITTASGAVLFENLDSAIATWDVGKKILKLEISPKESEIFCSTVYCPVVITEATPSIPKTP